MGVKLKDKDSHATHGSFNTFLILFILQVFPNVKIDKE